MLLHYGTDRTSVNALSAFKQSTLIVVFVLGARRYYANFVRSQVKIVRFILLFISVRVLSL